ncbi:RNA-directed DNA polymerase, eukaryota, reverse transcriptase zinc-binding domain protein [Tanacetum coccineum]
MKSVTTAAFTLNINGDRCGDFKSARGLRQGNPISPYLFTLVMEVITLIMKTKVGQINEFKFHDGCKEMESTHLCFTDDLLMMCHRDHKLVNVINEVLKEFSLASGLKPNMNKRTIFFGSVNPIGKKRIMEIIMFVEEILPMKYFGIPLVTKVIGVMDCSLLVEKVKGKVRSSIFKIALKMVYCPKSQGGLGLKLLGPWN